MNLLATIAACLAATSSAFTPPLALCEKFHSHNMPSLFARSDSDADASVPYFADVSSCGPGFKKIEGEDGPCCAYDFDEVSSKLTPGVFDNNPTLRSQFEDKNIARKKFALPPLKPEEFVVLQAQIHAMERDQGDIQSVAKQAIVEEREERERLENKAPGILQSFMEGILQDSCQSNFDCERPEVCCDFGFKKVCCSSGNTNRDIQNEMQLIRVPMSGE